MEDTVWEVMTLRFPHLARKIFERLEDKDFARCEEVCRPWKYFYDNEKPFQKRIKTFPSKFKDWTETEDEIGRVPLHRAAEKGQLQLCKMILDISKRIKKNPQDKYGLTPLHLAAQNGNFPIYQLIVKKLPDVYDSKNPSDLCGTTPLHLAAKNGHLFLCTTIIQTTWCKDRCRDRSERYIGKTIVPTSVWCYDPRNKDGDTPLLMAAENGHLSVCKLFIDRLDKKETKGREEKEASLLDDIVEDRKKRKLKRKVEKSDTVKLGDKERFDKEQIGVKEPFPVTNLPFTS